MCLRLVPARRRRRLLRYETPRAAGGRPKSFQSSSTGPGFRSMIGAYEGHLPSERAALHRGRARRSPSFLLSEVRAPELPRLSRREPWCVKRAHHLVGEFPLSERKTRRIVPAQSSSYVVVDPRLRTSELVSAPMQLAHLVEQCLEHVVIDRQEEATLLAFERRPRPAPRGRHGGRSFLWEEPPEDGSARRSTGTLTHTSRLRRPALRSVRRASRAPATRAPRAVPRAVRQARRSADRRALARWTRDP